MYVHCRMISESLYNKYLQVYPGRIELKRPAVHKLYVTGRFLRCICPLGRAHTHEVRSHFARCPSSRRSEHKFRQRNIRSRSKDCTAAISWSFFTKVNRHSVHHSTNKSVEGVIIIVPGWSTASDTYIKVGLQSEKGKSPLIWYADQD